MVTNPAINDIIRISEFFNRGDGLKKYKYSTKNIVIAISFSVLWCVLAFYLIFVCSRNGSVLGAAMLFGISMVCPAVYVIILSVKSRHNFVELHDEYFTYSVDGAKGQVLACESRQQKNWQDKENEKQTYVSMDGQAVFKFAVKKVPEIIGELLQKADLTEKDIDLFVLHQANLRIIESVAKRMKTDLAKFPVNIEEYGNTSSASIPSSWMN